MVPITVNNNNKTEETKRSKKSLAVSVPEEDNPQLTKLQGTNRTVTIVTATTTKK